MSIHSSNLTNPNRVQNSAAPVQFTGPKFTGLKSAGLSKAASGYTRTGIDRPFGWVGANRTREMLVEDLVGFGLLRTTMDLLRGYFYGTGEANWTMARERVIRELGSIFTDNVSSGLAAFGLGVLLDKKMGAYSNQFTSFQALELFQTALKNAPDKQVFLKNLLGELGEQASSTVNWEALAKSSEETATALAKALGKTDYKVMLNNESVYLPELLKDVSILDKQVSKRLASGNSAKWAETAEQMIAKTLKAKKMKLGMLSVGIVSTLAVPYLNHWLTRRLDKIDYYPGEIGLNKTLKQGQFAQNQSGMNFSGQPALTGQPTQNVLGTAPSFQSGELFKAFQQQQQSVKQAVSAQQNPFATAEALNFEGQSKLEKLFPYLTKATKEKNYIPLAVSGAPLVFAFGLFDAVNRKFNNPLKKGFGKLLRNSYDFGKGFPFTTQQQMASMFAFLIFSRLTTARSGNEFRERTVDSFLGWFLWILGTPILKRNIAKALQKKTGSELLKEVGGKMVLKTRQEIAELLTGPVRDKTLKQFDRMGSISVLVSMALMGIVEPYIAMKWTKRNAEK